MGWVSEETQRRDLDKFLAAALVESMVHGTRGARREGRGGAAHEENKELGLPRRQGCVTAHGNYGIRGSASRSGAQWVRRPVGRPGQGR